MIGSISLNNGGNLSFQNYQRTSYIGANRPEDTKTNNIAGVLNTKETNAANGVTKGECQTCKERKYIDGSNENNVSFKTPGHISPEASRAVVSAHEQQHVSNAVKEGNKEGAELVSASVSLKTSICPECGRSYVSGGTTKTQIKYVESNPYEQARKTIEGSFFKGQNIDMVA